MIEFFMHMIPPETTQQQKKVHVVNGKPHFYEPEDLKAARVKLMGHLSKYAPENKIMSPVRMTTKWCFPLAGSHKDGEYKYTKPDLDNSNKLLQDCMTNLGFWKDDAYVVSLINEKFWAEIPGIYIRIEEIE